MDYEVDVRKPELFNEMAKKGANAVSDRLNQLSGLDAATDMSTPSFVSRPANDIVNETGGWPGEERASVVDSTTEATDTDVEITVYTVPQLADLVRLIQDIDVATDVREDATATEVV